MCRRSLWNCLVSNRDRDWFIASLEREHGSVVTSGRGVVGLATTNQATSAETLPKTAKPLPARCSATTGSGLPAPTRLTIRRCGTAPAAWQPWTPMLLPGGVPASPWVLDTFRRAAEASNERRRAKQFTGRPPEAPESPREGPSPPPYAQERKRSVRDRYDTLTAALSGIRDRTRSALSEWWNHRTQPEGRAQARTRQDAETPAAQGHWPPRTGPTPRQAKPTAEPVRERPQATPSARQQTEPPRAKPTPPRQETRDMRPDIKAALNRAFDPASTRGRSRDGPKR